MGLEFKDSHAHWSYGGFAIFRRKLAKMDGIDIQKLKEWGGTIDCPNIPMREFYIHSDADGELEPHKLKIIVPRFSELMEMHKKEYGTEDYDTRMGYELLNTMKECIEDDVPLVFE